MVPSSPKATRRCQSLSTPSSHNPTNETQNPQTQTDPNFLRINTYLTAKISEDMIHNIVINDVGSDFDALTSLRSRTQFGRPNFPSIFSSIREGIEDGRYLPGRESSLRSTVGGEFSLS